MVCWCWVVVCWDGQDLVWCNFDWFVVFVCEFDDVVGVVVLVCFVVGDGVIGVCECWVDVCGVEYMGCEVCQQVGFCWSVDLVGDDFELFLFGCQVQYGFGKVVVMCGVDLVGLQDEVLVIVCVDGIFVVGFGGVIDI